MGQIREIDNSEKVLIEEINKNFQIVKEQFAKKEELNPLKDDISNMEAEIKTMKDSVLNNMTNNIFLETFNTLDSIQLEKGIYDPVVKKIYV